MYAIITVIIGIVFLIYGSINFIPAIFSKGSIVSQLTPLRIMISGVLFIFHARITEKVSEQITDFFISKDVEVSSTIIFWMAVIVLAAIQCMVIPSWRFLVLSEAIDSYRNR